MTHFTKDNLMRKDRLKTLIFLAWPAIAEQILGTLISYVDTGMVGVLGATATAAVAVNAACIWLANGILAGIGVGYSIQVANHIGAGETEKAKTVVRQAMLAMLVAGLTFLVLFQLLASHLPQWLGAKPDVLPQAVKYLRYYSLGFPFTVAIAIFCAVLRCMGDTRRPLFINTFSNILNIIFNFFLIYDTRSVTLLGKAFTVPGAGLGVSGAAIGSALAMAIAGILSITSVFERRRPIHIELTEDYRPDRAVIRQAALLGVPYMAERTTINLGQIAMTALVAHLGTVSLAANHIATTAEGFCYLPAYGISFAATALVGQAVGARNREDARAFGALSGIAGFLLSTLTGAILFLFARPLASLFTTDLQVITETALVLRIVSVSEPLFAASIVFSGALRGAHDVRFPMFLALGSMWGIRVVLAPIFVLHLGMGLAGVWAAMAIDLCIRGILCIFRWRSGRWITKSGLVQESETVPLPS